jgi:2-oxoisovalerate dehydrogenase E1 component alpha subunit
LIEWVTLRVGAHSTSDDPSVYRPADEAAQSPLGDPIDRLRRHVIAIGAWDDERHSALAAELEAEVESTFEQAAARGSAKSGHVGDPRTMFDDVFAELPRHLREQRAQVG